MQSNIKPQLKFLIIILGAVFYSCSNQSENQINENKKFEKLSLYSKESYQSRVEDLLSNYKTYNNFAFIDFKTCAKCSWDKINNFFHDLNKNEQISIIFNDSLVYFKYRQHSRNIEWNYLDPSIWDSLNLESSVIMQFKRLENDSLIRIE